MHTCQSAHTVSCDSARETRTYGIPRTTKSGFLQSSGRQTVSQVSLCVVSLFQQIDKTTTKTATASSAATKARAGCKSNWEGMLVVGRGYTQWADNDNLIGNRAEYVLCTKLALNVPTATGGEQWHCTRMVLESNVAGVVHTVTIYLGSIVMLHRTPFGRSDRIRIYSLPSSVTTTARCTASFAQDRTAKHVGQVQPKGVGSSRYGLLGRMDGPADFGRPTSDTMHRSNAQVRADPNPPVLPWSVAPSRIE